jgi:hypothetical protein
MQPYPILRTKLHIPPIRPELVSRPRKLSQLLRGFPGVLIFSRGHYCPQDRRQLTNYVAHLQPEFRVNYWCLFSPTEHGTGDATPPLPKEDTIPSRMRS